MQIAYHFFRGYFMTIGLAVLVLFLLSACSVHDGNGRKLNMFQANPYLVQSYTSPTGVYSGPGTLAYQQSLDTQRAVSKINNTKAF